MFYTCICAQACLEGSKHIFWVYILKCIGKGLSVGEFGLVQRTEVQLWLLHSILPAPTEWRSSPNSQQGITRQVKRGSLWLKLSSTSGALPGLDLIQMMVYEAATASSPGEESPYPKRHLRWVIPARAPLPMPPAWWAVVAAGIPVVT